MLFFIFVVFPNLLANGIIDRDLNLNLFSETWGLLFTLLFFVMLFELKDILEWKKVESRVKWRIGWEIYALFGNISTLCEVDTHTHGGVPNLSAWKDSQKRQLEQLSKGKVVLGYGKELLENSKLIEGYASIVATRKNALSGLEDKYFRFLNSEVQCSLMDIQIELERLYNGLKRIELFDIKDENVLTEPIEKIISEIAKIR